MNQAVALYLLNMYQVVRLGKRAPSECALGGQIGKKASAECKSGSHISKIHRKLRDSK